jgi:hypothetical protein
MDITNLRGHRSPKGTIKTSWTVRMVALILLFSVLMAGCTPALQNTPLPGSENHPTPQQATSTPVINLQNSNPTAMFAELLRKGILTQTPIYQESTSTPSPGLEAVNLAIDDLARRLEVQAAAIQLIDVRSDEFPAGDLGCPQPGVTPRPIPAFVTGQVILLEYQAERYIYHVHRTEIAFCGKQ